MTEHPAKGCTKSQIAAFEQIAIGQRIPWTQKTIDALLAKGLIEKMGDEVICRDRFGTVTVQVYEVPIPAHIQFCQWASEQEATGEK